MYERFFGLGDAIKRAVHTPPAEERREAGRRVNEARAALEAAAEERGQALAEDQRRLRLEAERLDLTEVPPGPGRAPGAGIRALPRSFVTVGRCG